MEAQPAKAVTALKTNPAIVGSPRRKWTGAVDQGQSAPEARNEADPPEKSKSELHGTRPILDIRDLAKKRNQPDVSCPCCHWAAACTNWRSGSPGSGD
jgi:hypothetical protein